MNNTSDIVARLAIRASAQHGAFTREQAHEAGWSDDRLSRVVGSGTIDQVGPNAYRSSFVPRSALGDLTALVLDIGPPCWASGPTAAALHGYDGFNLRAPFHVTTERRRNVRRLGHVIHTSGVLPRIDRAVVAGLRTTSPARTIIDLARCQPAPRLSAAVDSGIRDGLVSEDLLHRRIVDLRTSGRFGIPKLLEVLAGNEFTRGGHSWLEREFLRIVRVAGFPRPLTQQVLTRAGDRLVRVDVRFPGTRVVVELLGYRFHRSKADLDRDVRRLNALIQDGYLPLQFTYEQIVREPEAMLATLDVSLPGLRERSGRQLR